MHKSIPFMISAERTDRVDNPVHFSQGHSVQQTIQLSEIRFDLVIVYAVCIAISFIEKRQDRFAVSKIQLAGRHIGFQCPEVFLLGYIGSLSDSQMKQVNTALKCSLEL